MTKPEGHARWVRISHAILGASVLTLVFSGFTILLAHPRLYWGNAGNDLMPALIELPFGKRYPGITWEPATPFFETAGAPFTASRTVEPFNQNGWARSLHFLAAWWLVVPGLIYLAVGLARGHLRSNIVPGTAQLAPDTLWHDIANHLRLKIPPATGGPQYGVLQRIAYSMVIFVAAPLVVLSGLAMSPAVTAAFPILLDLFGGFQSARTVHFGAFIVLILFSLAHVAMVALSGFRKQIRGMTLGG